MEIIQKVWPGDNPFVHDRHQICKAVKHELGTAGRDLNFNAYADQPLAVPLRHAHAADRRSPIFDRHLDAVRGLERGDLRGAGRGRPAVRREQPTAAISRRRARFSQKHGGLWFYDESYVISRRRE